MVMARQHLGEPRPSRTLETLIDGPCIKVLNAWSPAPSLFPPARSLTIRFHHDHWRKVDRESWGQLVLTHAAPPPHKNTASRQSKGHHEVSWREVSAPGGTFRAHFPIIDDSRPPKC